MPGARVLGIDNGAALILIAATAWLLGAKALAAYRAYVDRRADKRIAELAKLFTPTVPTGLMGDYRFKHLRFKGQPLHRPPYDWSNDE